VHFVVQPCREQLADVRGRTHGCAGGRALARACGHAHADIQARSRRLTVSYHNCELNPQSSEGLFATGMATQNVLTSQPVAVVLFTVRLAVSFCEERFANAHGRTHGYAYGSTVVRAGGHAHAGTQARRHTRTTDTLRLYGLQRYRAARGGVFTPVHQTNARGVRVVPKCQTSRRLLVIC